jgi:hypothetical protein
MSTVGVTQEDGLAVVAALDHVVRVAGDAEAGVTDQEIDEKAELMPEPDHVSSYHSGELSDQGSFAPPVNSSLGKPIS